MPPVQIDINKLADFILHIKQIRPTIDRKSNHFAFICKKKLTYENIVAFSTNFIPVNARTKSIHAEHGCYEQLLKKLRLAKHRKIKRKNKKERYVMFAAKMSPTCTIGNSRPCLGCILDTIKINSDIDLNIKIDVIYYTYSDEISFKENFDEMCKSNQNRFSSGDNRKCN